MAEKKPRQKTENREIETPLVGDPRDRQVEASSVGKFLRTAWWEPGCSNWAHTRTLQPMRMEEMKLLEERLNEAMLMVNVLHEKTKSWCLPFGNRLCKPSLDIPSVS